MKKIIIMLVFVSFTTLIAQDKYMIYFKDKGQLNKQSLSKKSSRDILAKKYLSKRSIERRKKSLSENYFTFEDLPIEEKYISKIKQHGIKIHNKLKWFNAVSAYLNVEELELLKSKSFIDKIEKVRKVKNSKPVKNVISETQSLKKHSALHTYDYGPSLTQNELSDIPQIHDMGITGEGVRIGILDSGFDWETHVSLSSRKVIAEYDFIYKDTITANDEKDSTLSQHSHGTSVFSIIGGFDEGNVVGPAFNAEFILAKTEFIPTETHAEEDNYAAALEWMDSIGVDITTSSLGYSEFDETDFSYTYEDMDGNTTIVTKAAELAFNKGIVVITSAGNEGNLIGNNLTSWYYITAPGDGKNTITIGAVSSSNNLASFSSRGPTFDGRLKPEIVAQGVSVFKANAGSSSGYSFGNGTSYSAPIAAGISGLLLSAFPHLTNMQVRDIMMESGDNVDNPNNEVGFGLISALKALTYPNLQKIDNSYILHKIFDASLDLEENSIEVVIDGSRYPMQKNGNIYTVELPLLTLGQNYEFYFGYKNSENITQRVPSDKNYNFDYGKLGINLILTDIFENNSIPDSYSLSQNYPNPFNPTTTINYSIPKAHANFGVVLKLYNVLGAEVKTLVNEKQQAGNYSVDLSSNGLSSGVYFYQLKAGEFTQTKKLTILK